METNYLQDELYEKVRTDPAIFDFLQDWSLDGIWYWDLTQMDQEWMSPKFWTTLGYDPSQKKHLASEWQDIIFPEDLETAKTNLTRHLENPNYPYDQIVRYHHKTGYTVYIRCRGIAVRDENGTPLRMMGAHTDMTAMMASATHQSALEYQVQALQMQIETLNMRLKMKRNRINFLEKELKKCTGENSSEQQ